MKQIEREERDDGELTALGAEIGDGHCFVEGRVKLSVASGYNPSRKVGDKSGARFMMAPKAPEFSIRRRIVVSWRGCPSVSAVEIGSEFRGAMN